MVCMPFRLVDSVSRIDVVDELFPLELESFELLLKMQAFLELAIVIIVLQRYLNLIVSVLLDESHKHSENALEEIRGECKYEMYDPATVGYTP
jgi:hypothetical protein